MAQVKTQKVGINAFVSKPCEPLVLMQTMERVLTQTSSINKTIETTALLRGKTILIADDSEPNRDLIKHALGKLGILTLEAAHGQAVLEQLELSPQCAAVLMDIRMPGLDGLEASRLIRNKTSAYQSVPIIAITGDTDKENIETAFSVGIDDYIVKPIDIDDLVNKLIFLCEHKQQNLSEIPLFDFERLDHFKKNGIFKDGINNSYVRQTKESLIILENSAKNKDFAGIQGALHFLKGSSFTVGAQAFAHLIKKYEQQTNHGDWPDEEYWFEKIKALHTQTLAALQAHFNQPS
jgi:two-component system CAI-1 autoinducer sensor kinase/phosphatase CqsS